MQKIFHSFSKFILRVNIILINNKSHFKKVLILYFLSLLFSCNIKKINDVKINEDKDLFLKKNEILIKNNKIIEAINSSINFYQKNCNKLPSYILLTCEEKENKVNLNLDCSTYDDVLFQLEPFKKILYNSDGVMVIDKVLVICKFANNSEFVKYNKQIEFKLNKTNVGCYLSRSYNILNEKTVIEYENFIQNVKVGNGYDSNR